MHPTFKPAGFANEASICLRDIRSASPWSPLSVASDKTWAQLRGLSAWLSLSKQNYYKVLLFCLVIPTNGFNRPFVCFSANKRFFSLGILDSAQVFGPCSALVEGDHRSNLGG